MAQKRNTIIILVAVFLAVLAVSVAVVLLLPDASETTSVAPTSTVTPSLPIDTRVFERTDYSQVNTSLLQQGALPVAPPPTAGKANPFL